MGLTSTIQPMLNGLERAGNYLVSVPERTFGIQLGKRFYNDFSPEKSDKKTLALSALTGGTIQIIFPRWSRFLNAPIMDAPESNSNDSYTQEFLKLVGDYAFDLSLIAAIAHISDGNVAETLTLKFIANVATHVGFDLVEVGTNKIKSFRSSATTLAV